MTDAASPLDQRALRRAFGAFPTGVTITTTLDETGDPVGFTANSFTSVSLDPPLLLVCLARTASSFSAFAATPRFAVNVLAAGQREASATFATRGADKFAAVRWAARTTGAPVLDGVAAWFDCETDSVAPAGDHVILVGRVVGFGDAAAEPLGYWRGAYVRFGPAEDAAGGVRVAAIVERRREALIRFGADGRASLPSAAAFGPAGDAASLVGQLAQAGVWAELPFVFASYDAGDTHTVVYRGAAHDAPDPAGDWRFTPFDALPFDRIDPAEARALRAYVAERAAHAYGRYVGDASTWTA
jgi:flavin reductase (DIM6/NTAB) family NADH-FMN oxidoreductase RutF